MKGVIIAKGQWAFEASEKEPLLNLVICIDNLVGDNCGIGWQQ